MSARHAEGPNHSSGVLVTKVKPILNYDMLANGLSSHPDQTFVSRILTYCKDGVPIGYQGPRSFRDCSNWPSASKFNVELAKNIANEVKLGRKCGPFDKPPFNNYVASPMGAYQKHSGKVRIIQDLSWPPGKSINDYISSEDYSLQYISIDDIMHRIQLYGSHALIAKLDLADAFRHINVRQEDWELLGTVFNHDVDGVLVKKYYFDVVLPFGLRSSPKLFSDFADALQYIMLQRGVSECHHYMDDYITLGPRDSSQCADNLDIMIDTCNDIGFALNPAKVIGPSSVLEYLGFILDTTKMEVRISRERLDRIYAELCVWHGRRKCTKRELLSLIGKLIFISKVVRSGRSFVRRLIEVSKRAKHLHHRIKLDRSAQEDITWWLLYLPSWNGISIFMDSYWSTNVDVQLFTDASDIAVAGFFQGEWFTVSLDSRTKSMSINWRELYAIVIAIATWGQRLKGKQILIHCDNMSICHILKKGTSKNSSLMKLVRLLFYFSAHYNIICSAEYIHTYDNCVADSLSRLQFDRFRTLVPNAHMIMTKPYPVNMFL